MGGRTGYPDFSNSDAFGGPTYFEDLEIWADGVVADHVDTQANINVRGPGWGGRLRFVDDEQRLYTQSQEGGDFVPIQIGFAQAAGVVSVAATGTTAVTFPVGRFTVAPIVQATVVSTTGSVVSLPWLGAAPTSTGFSIRIFTTAAGQVAGVVHWTAVQMTTTTAAG